MKFARVRTASTTLPIVLSGDAAYDLSGELGDLRPDTLPLLAEAAAAAAGGRLNRVDLQAVEFAAPVHGVGAVLAIGMNYAAHAAESGSPPPTLPVMFLKTPNTVGGPNDPVRIPRAQPQDRLGGRAGDGDRPPGVPSWPMTTTARLHRRLHRRQRPVRADFQLEDSGGQWSKGKCCPGSTRSARGWSPRTRWTTRSLRLRSWVNGEPRQDSSTADMIFERRRSSGTSASTWRWSPAISCCTGTPRGRRAVRPLPLPDAPVTWSRSRSTGWAVSGTR